MLKIFVTGDNHIGLKYQSHPQAKVLAAKRLEAFDGMVAAANQEDCDLFVITGDLFENTYSISKQDIKKLLDMLSQFRGTVAVLPGNHDFYDPNAKVWQIFREMLSSYDNILLLTEYRPYELTVGGETVVLYPALCTTLHSASNNLGWMKGLAMAKDGAYHIGVAHGAVEGETIDNEARYFLMKRAELESIPVDVWLIGHTHVPFPKHLTDTFAVCDKILNAGTHVQTDVNCATEGLCFVVEIDADKTVRAKKFVSGNLRFYQKAIHMTAGHMADTLRRKLADFADNSVVRLTLTGAVSAEEYEHRAELIDSALSRFIEGEYNDASLSKQITKETIDAEFPETSISAGLLTALLPNPKEAQLAYELLQALKKEGK